jgi:hypothetical protein
LDPVALEHADLTDAAWLLLLLLLLLMLLAHRPWHNIISVFVMACVCFYPRFSLFAFLLWRSVVSLRRLLMHVSCVWVCRGWGHASYSNCGCACGGVWCHYGGS